MRHYHFAGISGFLLKGADDIPTLLPLQRNGMPVLVRQWFLWRCGVQNTYYFGASDGADTIALLESLLRFDRRS